MKEKNMKSINTVQYNEAVQRIKSAILRSQHRAVRSVNNEQLSLYFSIGKYVSLNSREGFWGTSAIEAISNQLQKELPGLRGFSATSIKKMRKFFEAWSTLLNRQPSAVDLITTYKPDTNHEIDNEVLLSVNRPPLAGDLDISEFLSISFSHHIEIIEKVKSVEERVFYIHQTVVNRWDKYTLRSHLNADDFHHQGTMPNR